MSREYQARAVPIGFFHDEVLEKPLAEAEAIVVMVQCCESLHKKGKISSWDERNKTLSNAMDASKVLKALKLKESVEIRWAIQNDFLNELQHSPYVITLTKIYHIICEHEGMFNPRSIEFSEFQSASMSQRS